MSYNILEKTVEGRASHRFKKMRATQAAAYAFSRSDAEENTGGSWRERSAESLEKASSTLQTINEEKVQPLLQTIKQQSAASLQKAGLLWQQSSEELRRSATNITSSFTKPQETPVHFSINEEVDLGTEDGAKNANFISMAPMGPAVDGSHAITFALELMKQEEEKIKGKDLVRGLIIASRRWISLTTTLATLSGELLRTLSNLDNISGLTTDVISRSLSSICRARELAATIALSLSINRTAHQVVAVCNYVIPRLASIESTAREAFRESYQTASEAGKPLAVDVPEEFVAIQLTSQSISSYTNDDVNDWNHLYRVVHKPGKNFPRLQHICEYWCANGEVMVGGAAWDSSEITNIKQKEKENWQTANWGSNTVLLQELEASADSIEKFCHIPSHPCLLDTFGYLKPSTAATTWSNSTSHSNTNTKANTTSKKSSLFEIDDYTLESEIAYGKDWNMDIVEPAQKPKVQNDAFDIGWGGKITVVREPVLRSFHLPTHFDPRWAASQTAQLLRAFLHIHMMLRAPVVWRQAAVEKISAFVGHDGGARLDVLEAYADLWEGRSCGTPEGDNVVKISAVVEKIVSLAGLIGDHMMPRNAVTAMQRLEECGDAEIHRRKIEICLSWMIVALEKLAIGSPFQEKELNAIPEDVPHGLEGETGEKPVRYPLEVTAASRIMFGKRYSAEWLPFGGLQKIAEPGYLNDLYTTEKIFFLTETEQGVKITLTTGPAVAEIHFINAQQLDSTVKKWPAEAVELQGQIPKDVCYVSIDSNYLPNHPPIIICGNFDQRKAVAGLFSSSFISVAPEGKERLGVLTKNSLWLRPASKALHHLLIASFAACLMRYVHLMDVSPLFNPLKVPFL